MTPTIQCDRLFDDPPLGMIVFDAPEQCASTRLGKSRKIWGFSNILISFTTRIKSIGTWKMKFKDSRITRLPWEVHNMMDILLKSFWCTKDYLKFNYPMKALEGYFPNLHNTTLFESAWNWPTLGSRGHEEVDQAKAQRSLRTSERSYWPHTGTIWAKFT